MKQIIRYAWIPLLAIGVFACGGNTPPDSASQGQGNPVGTSVPSGDNTQATAPVERAATSGGNFLSSFPTDRILSGGVPKDGIPALTDPQFVDLTSSDANYVLEDDLILGVVINGEAKAYPHNMGWWHEIVNDVVGGQPIVVSFCPLTGTGLVFNGQGDDGNRITCGVSGLLFNNNLIMYDRRDNATLYPQMIHTSIDGSIGSELELMPVIETTWRFWKQLYPNSKVVSVRAGTYSSGRYTQYPYGSYRDFTQGPNFASFPALEANPTAQFFPPKTITLGIRFGEKAKAYPFPIMGEEAVINDTFEGTDLVVVFYEQEQYAVPFSREFNDQILTFEKVASTDQAYPFLMRDNETGTVWNLKGEALSGTFQGRTLTPIASHNGFWFAWATFWQNTGIY
ncbi:MAG: DUF3179 domain-containing protein [Candidatus Latescibacteria bacterium]|nr:DUF3179 domain-containing protein [Candidatus Latescibacterota bacterium]